MPIIKDVGELKWRGTILIQQDVKDSMGGHSSNQSEYKRWKNVYGKLVGISARDLWVAGQNSIDYSCKFIIRYDRQIFEKWMLQQPSNSNTTSDERNRAKMRIIIDNQTYNVTEITDPDAGKHWLQISLKEVWSNQNDSGFGK